MEKFTVRSVAAGTLGVLALALFLSAAAAPPQVQPPEASAPGILLNVDPAQSKVHWTVDTSLHTVHGTFNVKSGTVHFDPESGKAGGEIVVFATSGDSGNTSRDARMHKEILESAEYPDLVFHPSQVEGKVLPSGVSDVRLRGVISIHGTDHELIAPVHAELAGDHWNGTARFEVPYVQWGIKDPSNFFLKVKKVVKVEIEMSGDAKRTPENP